MLEITAGQMIRLSLFGLLLLTLLVAVYIGFTSMYLKQQMQAASDLLSSTGGYMRTEQQQQEWWSLTHNPIMQLTNVHYVGITEADRDAGIITGKIDRGAPAKLHDSDALTTYIKYQINDAGIGSPDGNISGSTFADVENSAKNSSGGVALNGPTGVHVNEKMLKKAHGQRTGYMMVPAHYGTSIHYEIQSRIPVWYIHGGNDNSKFDKKSESFITGTYEGQTASLRGNDQLYINGGNEVNEQNQANLLSRATGLFKMATGQAGVDSQKFGYGQVGVNLNSSSMTVFQGQAQTLSAKWIDKIQSDKTNQEIVNDTKAGLTEINNLFTKNGGVYTDPGSHRSEHFATEKPGLSPYLVFRTVDGRNFTVQNLPNDYRLWPRLNS